MTCLWKISGYNDLCPLWDDDGRAYLVMTCYAPDPITKAKYNIHLFNMAKDGMSLEKDSSHILHRSNGSEANKLDKRDGIYYHYFSEVKAEGRVPMMRRSPSLEGPWEERQLDHVDPKVDKEPNQGGLVQAPNGTWWFLTHQGSGDWEGRALCLLPVTWIDGWPIIGKPGADGIGNMVWEAELPVPATKPQMPELSGDFSTATLGPHWEWNHVPRPEMWSLTRKPGWLHMSAFPPAQPGFKWVGNILSQRSWRTMRNVVVTQMDVSEMADGQVAGLSHASKTFAHISVVQTNGNRRLYFTSDSGSKMGPLVQKEKIWLRSKWDVDGQAQFSFSLDGRRYTDFGPGHSLGWGDYRGDRVGLFTFNPERTDGYVSFDRFDYRIAPQNGNPVAGAGNFPAAYAMGQAEQ